jgi:hypothetical protein
MAERTMFIIPWTSRLRHAALLALLLLGLGAIGPVRAQGQWQYCAVQDEICRFEGQATVRYGADGKYAYKVARNRIICDELEFGDPVFGRPKRCEYSAGVTQLPGGPSQNDWVPCASEGEMCSFSGSARVRYGTDNRYVYRNATNSVRCSVSVFGDPAYGRHKTCDYQLHALAGPVVPERGWEYCASEGGTCHFSGMADVRYGAQGRWVTMRGINGLPCSVDTFGRDPIYGQRKQCFVRAAR